MSTPRTKRSQEAPPPAAAPHPRRRRYRINEWCQATGTSRATAWRRIKDGTLTVTYYGKIPFIVGGPAAFFE